MAITFSDLGSPAQNGNLLIVDGLNIAFRWKHQGVLDFKYDYIRTVESLAKSYNAGQIIILADGGSVITPGITFTCRTCCMSINNPQHLLSI